MSTVKKDDFQKSLADLAQMAKSSPQLHHTANDSDPGQWAGSRAEDQDEHESKIDVNGTDYNGVRKSLALKIRKSQALTPAEVAIADGFNPLPLIADKVSKGVALTRAEEWALKGGLSKMQTMPGMDEDKMMYAKKGNAKPGAAGTPGEDDDAVSVPDTHGGQKMDGSDVEDDARKSFNNTVNSSLELQKGLELSPFLYELTRAIGSALGGSEARVVKSLQGVIGSLVTRLEAVEKSVASSAATQDEFNKSLAEAVVGIGNATIGATNEEINKAQMPVGGPRSQIRAATPDNSQGYVNKSYAGPGGLDMDLTKSQITNAMVDMVEKSLLDPSHVIKFEGHGELDPSVRNRVLNHLNGGNR